MPTQTPCPHDDWRQGNDHDALQALLAENLATDATDAGDPSDW